MNYKNIATTVFTPIEYGSVGYSEEAAIEQFGKDNINVYHSEFLPLEWNLNKYNTHNCYVKVIVNSSDKNKVIGIHLLSPGAGEIIQGFSTALNLGMTKEDLDNTIGIHPTNAEELTLLKVDKSQGDGKKEDC